jgi:hypothetical protein
VTSPRRHRSQNSRSYVPRPPSLEVPSAYVSIYPALTYRDVRAAIAWLETAFGLEGDIVDDADGAADHAVLKYGSGMAMVESERPEDLHGSHTGKGWIYICGASELRSDRLEPCATHARTPDQACDPALLSRQALGVRSGDFAS